jgi:hypothetical protein
VWTSVSVKYTGGRSYMHCTANEHMLFELFELFEEAPCTVQPTTTKVKQHTRVEQRAV